MAESTMGIRHSKFRFLLEVCEQLPIDDEFYRAVNHSSVYNVNDHGLRYLDLDNDPYEKARLANWLGKLFSFDEEKSIVFVDATSFVFVERIGLYYYVNLVVGSPFSTDFIVPALKLSEDFTRCELTDLTRAALPDPTISDGHNSLMCWDALWSGLKMSELLYKSDPLKYVFGWTCKIRRPLTRPALSEAERD